MNLREKRDFWNAAQTGKRLARDLLDQLKQDIRKSAGQIQKGAKMTFYDLATLCEKTFYSPADTTRLSTVHAYHYLT